MIKAVIFDIDDTLFPETEFAMSGFRVVARKLSNRLTASEEELFSLMRSLYFEDRVRVFNRLFDKIGVEVTPEELNEIIHIYRYHDPQISCFYDAYSTLADLKKQGYKLGIISNGYSVVQRTKLRALGVYEFFDEIIVSEDLGENGKKPNILPFQTMKERLGVEYDEMMYIGDNPEVDFYVSKHCPISTVQINRGGINAMLKYRENITPKFYLSSLFELSKVLKR